MSKIYLPTAEQMEETLDNLNKIAIALGSTADTSSWRGIQSVVRSGLAPELFPIGTQFTVPHSKYGNIAFDVVAYDYFKSRGNENAHTMTLLSHDIIASVSFDVREAFYYAENELPAGTYNFTLDADYSAWLAGTYQFTLTKALPKGGQLALNGDSLVSLKSLSVVSHDNPNYYYPNVFETCAITEGSNGTNLGTFGVELNHVQRVGQGSNNYKESAIRQFLNSSSTAAAEWWYPKTKFDRPPNWVYTSDGFMRGLNDDFKEIIGKVNIPCIANNMYESPDSTTSKGDKYVVTDKLYLASVGEISGQHTYEDNVVQFPYFENGTSTDFMKYENGVVNNWWTRTPNITGARSAYLIKNTGAVDFAYCTASHGLAIACTIA